MPAVAAVGAVAGGVIASKGAKDGAKAQAAGAAQANATESLQYETTRRDNLPFRQSGVGANNQLAYMLGLQGATRPGSVSSIYGVDPTTSRPGESNNPLWEKVLSDFDAAHRKIYGGTDASAFENNYSVLLQTYRDTLKNNPEIQRQLAEEKNAPTDPQFGSLMRNFSQSDLDNDVPYQTGLQFGLNEGTKGLNRLAAASGGLNSGAQLKALTRFGNDYGNTKANEAYNRFNTNKMNTYNMLAGVSGAGQAATNQVSAAGQNMANNISQNQIGVGNARAASSIGQANAWGNAIGQGVNMWQQNRLMNQPTAGGWTNGFDLQ